MTRPKLRYLERRWNRLGREDPLWGVYSDPEKRWSRWNLDLGCGVERLTQALAAHFDEVSGVTLRRRVTKTGSALIFSIPEPTLRQWSKRRFRCRLVRADVGAVADPAADGVLGRRPGT